jgi:hypothetical protein
MACKSRNLLVQKNNEIDDSPIFHKMLEKKRRKDMKNDKMAIEKLISLFLNH